MRNFKGLLLLGAMTLAGGALAQEAMTQPEDTARQQEQQREADVPKDTGAMQEGTGGAGMEQDPKQLMKEGMLPIPKEPQDFLTMLHADNLAEVKLAQQAQQKASSKQVKDYARMMQQDHSRADQQLTQLAQQKNLKLEEEARPDNELARALHAQHKATLDALGQLEGKAFDQAYLAAMVMDHDQAIAKLHTARQQFSSDKQLTAMVDKLVPQLMKHRERAYKLLGQEKPQLRQARTPASRR